MPECSGCKFFVPGDVYTHTLDTGPYGATAVRAVKMEGYGRCHKRSPLSSAFPAVHQCDHCGDWEERNFPPVTPEALAEAARHVYGGSCDRKDCMWCEEWNAIKDTIYTPRISPNNAMVRKIRKLDKDRS